MPVNAPNAYWRNLLAVFPRDVVDASDGWEAADGGVRPVVVIHVEPLGKQVEPRRVQTWIRE
jgi:hypothetical protein